MKKVFKVGCLGFIGIIVLIVIAAVAFGGEGTDSTTESTNTTEETPATSETETEAPEAEEEATEEPAEEPTADGKLTAEKFDQIKSGMTYEEVVAVIGSEGTVMSESGDAGTEFHTIMYEWETDGAFSAATFMFQGGTLQNKSQVGVSNTDSPEVTMDQFNEIQNGMTTEEVFAILGGEGEIQSESGEVGSEYYTVMYSYPGASGLGSNVSLMFMGDKLENKSQFGLE